MKACLHLPKNGLQDGLTASCDLLFLYKNCQIVHTTSNVDTVGGGLHCRFSECTYKIGPPTFCGFLTRE